MKHGTSIPRSIRLAQLQQFLHRNPRGLTTQELAKLCGVCVRTVQRDLLDLQSELDVPITQDGKRYGLLGGFTLPPVFFSLYEATALFLVSRLALRQSDENNPHLAGALSKMAGILPPELAQQLLRSTQAFTSKPSNPEYVRVYEHVATAWSARRQLRMNYLSLHATQAKEWLLEPYFMEATGVGYSTYVIGHATREGKEGIITFKLDRISDVEILGGSFEIPPEFDVFKLLSGSWGVIWGQEAVVRLKFSASVTRRVKESVWHPSQTIKDLPDGGCLLTVEAGSMLEMTPWIRSWGPDVEVLEPVELREQFKEWARQLNAVYDKVR